MKHLIVFLLVASFFSCNKNTNSSKTTESHVVFELFKTTCRGKCASYRLTISSDGSMVYKGIKNVVKEGIYSKKMSQDELSLIVKQFDNSKFFEFEDKYMAKITDLPTTYISYTKDNVTKKITDYHGSPEELKKLEKVLMEIGKSPDWKFVEPLPPSKKK